VKIIPILAALALFSPVAASAQSLNDTHILVWHPAGKAPIATWRMRAKTPCVARAVDHRTGKGPIVPAKNCPVETARLPATAPAPAN